MEKTHRTALAPDLLVYPDYDGNGMFKSLGNMRTNPQVGLLFIAMTEKPKRLQTDRLTPNAWACVGTFIR